MLTEQTVLLWQTHLLFPPHSEINFVFFRSVANTSRNLLLWDGSSPDLPSVLTGSHLLLLFSVPHYVLQYPHPRKIFILNSLVFFDCRYNVVFKYLLSVRRVQAELQHCWALQMQRKHLKSNRTDAIKWRLRDHMAFLVDNLQYYLQVRIIEKGELCQIIRNWQNAWREHWSPVFQGSSPLNLKEIRIFFGMSPEPSLEPSL